MGLVRTFVVSLSEDKKRHLYQEKDETRQLCQEKDETRHLYQEEDETRHLYQKEDNTRHLYQEKDNTRHVCQGKDFDETHVNRKYLCKLSLHTPDAAHAKLELASWEQPIPKHTYTRTREILQKRYG
jgi:hypothetical protein